MPRHVQIKYQVFRASLRGPTLGEEILLAGADQPMLVFELANKTTKRGKRILLTHIYECAVKARWKWFNWTPHQRIVPDSLERVPGRMYVGLVQIKGALQTEFRDVTVPRYFVPRLEQMNESKQAADRQQILLIDRIGKVRNKVYLSRNFPATLRAVIFQRDEYRCQVCGRDRGTLSKLGHHLEVDHIHAFVDGGKTTYENGQTLCNQCNTAKHQTKPYFDALARTA